MNKTPLLLLCLMLSGCGMINTESHRYFFNSYGEPTDQVTVEKSILTTESYSIVVPFIYGTQRCGAPFDLKLSFRSKVAPTAEITLIQAEITDTLGQTHQLLKDHLRIEGFTKRTYWAPPSAGSYSCDLFEATHTFRDVPLIHDSKQYNQIKIEYMVDDEVFTKDWNERGDIRKETHTLIGQARGM